MTDAAVAKPWLPGTTAGLAAAVDKLKLENPQELFVMLVRAAASGVWDVFTPAFERASGVKGLRLLLPAPDGLPMRLAYNNAGLPPEYWPVFVAVVEIARELTAGREPGKRMRETVFKRCLSRPAVAALPFAKDLFSRLAS